MRAKIDRFFGSAEETEREVLDSGKPGGGENSGSGMPSPHRSGSKNFRVGEQNMPEPVTLHPFMLNSAEPNCTQIGCGGGFLPELSRSSRMLIPETEFSQVCRKTTKAVLWGRHSLALAAIREDRAFPTQCSQNTDNVEERRVNASR